MSFRVPCLGLGKMVMYVHLCVQDSPQKAGFPFKPGALGFPNSLRDRQHAQSLYLLCLYPPCCGTGMQGTLPSRDSQLLSHMSSPAPCLLTVTCHWLYSLTKRPFRSSAYLLLLCVLGVSVDQRSTSDPVPQSRSNSAYCSLFVQEGQSHTMLSVGVT